MSWKAVELQVALPRTQDAGRIQEQFQQRGQFMQDIISQAQLQSEEMKRRTVFNLEEGHKLSNEQREEAKQQLEQKASTEESLKTKDKVNIRHPYLGTKIDING